jgi:energy-coupling factor transport system ATP-binding protein
MTPLLQIKNVSFQYTGIGGSNEPVLTDVGMEFFSDECVAICGPSGSGKTTLIQLFTGLLKPGTGSIFYRGRDIWSKGFSFSDLRRRIGLVFQFPETQLFEETVFKDVAFGPTNLGLPASEIEKRVFQALENVELAPALFKDRVPFRLSEGEKRRVAIAGVLAMGPEMVVFDEPTAGLDAKGVKCFKSIVRTLLEQNTTVVVITHNMDFVADVAQKVHVLLAGRVVFQGVPSDLFKNRELLNRTGLELGSFMTAMETLPVPPAWRHVGSMEELLALIHKQNNNK